MAKKKDDKLDLLTKVATGVAFGDTSNSAVRNILTEISKELYGRISNDQMHETMEFFEWKCPYTGEDLRPLIENGRGGYASDHIYPQNQSWCGLNVQGNLVLVTEAANNAKRGLDVETFLRTDTKVLKDLDISIRQERINKIIAFQTKFHYDPEKVRMVIQPLMEERYRDIRNEQEKYIQDAMAKLEANGIKPKVSNATGEKAATTCSSDTVGKGYTYDEKLGVVLYYLEHKEGLEDVEKKYMKLTGRNGATAKYILNKLGVDTSRKSSHMGLLQHSVNIDDEIAKATGTFKLTLEEIKKRSLI